MRLGPSILEFILGAYEQEMLKRWGPPDLSAGLALTDARQAGLRAEALTAHADAASPAAWHLLQCAMPKASPLFLRMSTEPDDL